MITPLLKPNQPTASEFGTACEPCTATPARTAKKGEQGLDEMRRLMTAGMVAAAVSVSAALGIVPAAAQGLSEKSVLTLMDYAWAITPERFTKPDGVTIVVDRNKRKEIEVPIETAREVIRVGRLSSHAQMCDMPDEQARNYRSLMLREAQKKKWSEQQMLYMNQLHLVTVMLLTGKLKLVEREEGKDLKVVQDPPAKTKDAKTDAKSCSPEQKAKVMETIAAYVKSGPTVVPKAAAGGSVPPPATPAAAKK